MIVQDWNAGSSIGRQHHVAMWRRGHRTEGKWRYSGRLSKTSVSEQNSARVSSHRPEGEIWAVLNACSLPPFCVPPLAVRKTASPCSCDFYPCKWWLELLGVCAKVRSVKKEEFKKGFAKKKKKKKTLHGFLGYFIWMYGRNWFGCYMLVVSAWEGSSHDQRKMQKDVFMGFPCFLPPVAEMDALTLRFWPWRESC